MLKIKNIKKRLVHIVCMIMLILIQFDVCGYDLMRAFYLADKPVTDLVSHSDVCINDNDDTVSEWSDPVYRSVNPRSLIKAPLLEFFSLTFNPSLRELSIPQRFAQVFQAKLSNLAYLRFCVFLI